MGGIGDTLPRKHLGKILHDQRLLTLFRFRLVLVVEPISEVVPVNINRVPTSIGVDHQIDFTVTPLTWFDPFWRTFGLKCLIDRAHIDGGAGLFLRSHFTTGTGLSEHRLGLTKTYTKLGLNVFCSEMEVAPIIIADHRPLLIGTTSAPPETIPCNRSDQRLRASRFSRSYSYCT